jgi:hypothetical protein
MACVAGTRWRAGRKQGKADPMIGMAALFNGR